MSIQRIAILYAFILGDFNTSKHGKELYCDEIHVHESAEPRRYCSKFHTPYMERTLEVGEGTCTCIGTIVHVYLYHIQDCACLRRKKVVHFNSLKPCSIYIAISCMVTASDVCHLVCVISYNFFNIVSL